MQDSTGEIRPHDTAFLSPHEVLAVVAQHSSPDMIYDLAGLDPSSLCQLQLLLEKWGLDQLIPISLWADTVPYSWDRSESVEVYSWHLPGQGHKPYRNMRVPFAIVQHHLCCKSTHGEIIRVWVWSMASLAKGKFPSHGPRWSSAQWCPENQVCWEGDAHPRCYNRTERRLEVVF